MTLTENRPIEVSTTTSAAVTLRTVTKRYGHGQSSVLALDGVSLSVERGEFLCIVGASGCGKSTLLSLVSGLDPATSGDVVVNGRTAFMFQEAALLPWRTAAQNVELALKLRGVPRAERALAQDADILLMDEPFGALDAITRDVLHDEIERVAVERGLTVLFVTHNVREASRLGDRIVLLSSRPGRVAVEFPVNAPRPRRIESPEISALAGEVTVKLREEVRRHAH